MGRPTGVSDDMLTLTTDRLLLRPFTRDDLDYTVDLVEREDVVRYLPWSRMDREEAALLLERRMASTALRVPGDALILAVEHRDTSTMVGDVMLRWDQELYKQAEIGYVFHPVGQGYGFATEAARAMLAYGFDQVGFHRIYAQCDTRHLASARVMERLGMRREAHFRENEWFKGEWGSLLIYAILEHEWPAHAD